MIFFLTVSLTKILFLSMNYLIVIKLFLIICRIWIWNIILFFNVKKSNEESLRMDIFTWNMLYTKINIWILQDF